MPFIYLCSIARSNFKRLNRVQWYRHNNTSTWQTQLFDRSIWVLHSNRRPTQLFAVDGIMPQTLETQNEKHLAGECSNFPWRQHPPKFYSINISKYFVSNSSRHLNKFLSTLCRMSTILNRQTNKFIPFRMLGCKRGKLKNKISYGSRSGKCVLTLQWQ